MNQIHSYMKYFRHFRLNLVLNVAFTATLFGVASASRAADRPELADIEYERASSINRTEARLLNAIAEPMITGKDVTEALSAWFDGRKAAKAGNPELAAKRWTQGLLSLRDVKPLPQADWGKIPDADLELLKTFSLPGMDGVAAWIVKWQVDGLTQYGVLIAPEDAAKKNAEAQYPLILYLHGAAYGVPVHSLPWLARMAREGYAIIGPAMRGEDLFATSYSFPQLPDLKCEGQIENLDGEVNDALSAVQGAFKLPFVKKDEFAILGHSFGAGAGLLAAARADNVACVVSYDAWLTNPFRYYWDRMRRGPNNWLSWAEYCNQPVKDQLQGLMKRSIVHHAEQLETPLLMFIGGAYSGSVFHKSHADLIKELKRHDKDYEYEVVPGGGHNFVLYFDSAPAKYAYAKHMKFLKKHFPPYQTEKAPETEQKRNRLP